MPSNRTKRVESKGSGTSNLLLASLASFAAGGLLAWWASTSSAGPAHRGEVRAADVRTLADAEPATPAPDAGAGLAPVDRTAERHAAQVESRVDATASAAAEPAAPGVELAPTDLLVELTTLLRSGRIEASLSGRVPEQCETLVETYWKLGDPQSAFDVVRRHPDADPALLLGCGNAFMEHGDRERAVEAIRLGLSRLPPGEEQGPHLRMLANLDPGAALAHLESLTDERTLRRTDPDSSLRLQLLARAGRGAEVVDLLQGLMRSGRATDACLTALDHLPTEQAEAFLRDALALDSSGAACVRLARILSGSERAAEARELLQGVLAQHPQNWQAVQALLQVDPGQGIDWVERAGGLVPAAVWGQVASAYDAQGRTGDAVEAWKRAFDADATDWGVNTRLLEHASGWLFSRIEQRARVSNDDEELGDLGDVYWQAKRYAEARALWQRAYELDPGDSEWINDLAREEGEDVSSPDSSTFVYEVY